MISALYSAECSLLRNSTTDFISGVSDDIHSVIIAGSKADLALQMTLQVRNKVMDAYKEIMNMQI